MAFDFPNDPAPGQVYTPVVSGPSWTWNGSTWVSVPSEAPNEAPIDGQVYGRQNAYWVPVPGIGLVDAQSLDGQDGIWYLDRVNHTGMQAQATVTNLVTDLTAKAPLASPVFTGNPTAPTPAPGDNDTSIATTAFTTAAIAAASGASGFVPEAPNDAKAYVRKSVTWAEGYDKATLDTALALKATLASPTFTGDPKAPTPTAGDNDTSIATTAFVTSAVATQKATDQTDYVNVTGDTMTGALTINHASGITTTGPVAATGNIGTQGTFTGAAANGILSNGAGAGSVLLRPNGPGSGTGQFTVNNNGNVLAAGSVGCWGDNTFFMGFVATERYLQFATGYGIRYYPTGLSIDFVVNAGVRFQCRASDGFVISYHGGAKPGGGPWADTSDARIKNVVGDYEGGLEQVKGLRPVVYTFKGNDTDTDPQADKATQAPYANSMHFQAATDGTEFVGFVAQEVEAVMPEMVTQKPGWIDGVEVSDRRDLDTNHLIYTLVNAVKELAARVEQLEAAP